MLVGDTQVGREGFLFFHSAAPSALLCRRKAQDELGQIEFTFLIIATHQKPTTRSLHTPTTRTHVYTTPRLPPTTQHKHHNQENIKQGVEYRLTRHFFCLNFSTSWDRHPSHHFTIPEANSAGGRGRGGRNKLPRRDVSRLKYHSTDPTEIEELESQPAV